jgi:TPP-dependent pyruvate/acetoin dehydrogenase alpha subunit
MAVVLAKYELLHLYERMLLIRRTEERIALLYQQGELPGIVHLSIGQEAVAVGVCSHLASADKITSTHRGHGHFLAKGGNVRALMAELYGKSTGACRGKGGSMHVTDFSVGIMGANGLVAGGIPIATGAGLAEQLRRTGRVAVSFFGDGATNHGAFPESLNLAAIWRLPVVYVCENNQYTEFTSTRALTAGEIVDRARPYGITTIAVDGQDVLKVHEAAGVAVDKARAGEGPSLIEAQTYRYRGHQEGEETFLKTRYRTEQEEGEWKLRDPIGLFAKRLGWANILDPSQEAEMERRIAESLDDAVAFAKDSSYPSPESAFEDHFASSLLRRSEWQ